MIKSEWRYLTSRKMMMVVLIAIALIPAIYCYLYLSSMWNTYGKMDQLPVGIVNNDQGSAERGHQLSIGKALVKQLQKSNSLDYHVVSKSLANRKLKTGKYFMILTIPKSFSAKATTLLSASPQQPKLYFEINSGQNFIVSKMTKGAITAINQKVATQITTLYTKAILNTLKNVTIGMSTAAVSSQRITKGSQQLQGELIASQKRNVTLLDGLKMLQKSQMASKSSIKNSRSNQMSVNQLAALTFGMGKTILGNKSLIAGSKKITSGNQLLARKLAVAAKELTNLSTTSKSAGLIANPVKETSSDVAKVPNNGTGMAPFAIAIGLYVGAIALGTMYDGYLPRRKPKLAFNWWFSKFSVVGTVSLVQTLFLSTTLAYGNHLHTFSEGWLFILILIGSLLFSSLIFFLRIWLGGFGTWLVSIILVLQLASSGGLYPTQLLSSLSSNLNPWLPMTYLIDSLRATISTDLPIQVDIWIMLGLVLALNALIWVKFKLDLNKPLLIDKQPKLARS
ncbi:YhgE/Pip family protein [Lentilactobacillus raoultii]|uniref:YhgE/Pip family protein n=1 Tax=Lentilactobacillus raoultii TaxID=1987503 RepID=A0ABW3PL42_9LACO|nr:YhgE/Pip family protein [Lentilactobacillus raoultii]